MPFLHIFSREGFSTPNRLRAWVLEGRGQARLPPVGSLSKRHIGGWFIEGGETGSFLHCSPVFSPVLPACCLEK